MSTNSKTTIAYLTEDRDFLASLLDNYVSHGWKVFAGGRELSDVTPQEITKLKHRLAQIDNAIAAHRERGD